jgi:hypothetical protein
MQGFVPGRHLVQMGAVVYTSLGSRAHREGNEEIALGGKRAGVAPGELVATNRRAPALLSALGRHKARPHRV